jgi:hypothetical protein
LVTTTELYGVDLALVNRDLSISSSGGYSSVSANDNLLQSISNRLTTEKGSLAYDADYGLSLGMFIGEKNVNNKVVLLQLEIIKELKKERRVSAINKVDITQDPIRPDILYINIEVLPINSLDPMNLNLIYPFYMNQSILRIPIENQTSTTKTTVTVTYPIYSVMGVFLNTDTAKTGKNYYLTSGSFVGNYITLSQELPQTNTQVIVDYEKVSSSSS